MPANDDVLHAKCQNRVLDGRGNTPVHLAVRRYNIAHVTGHEQIARCALGDQLRHDARIGAGDKHRPRVLRRGEFFEKSFLFREDFVMKVQKAINDMVQCCVGTFGRGRGLWFRLVSHRCIPGQKW